MASLGREFLSALKSVFGGTNKTFVSGIQTVGSAFLVASGPIEVYSILQQFNAASTAATIEYQNASASGLGGAGTIVTWAVTLNNILGNVGRPIRFDKGLAINFTATGAAGNTYEFVVTYSPLPNPFGGAG